ncbi:hypothetical protein RDWZM_009941 [Blomia tropicalis]|uniref:Uncharacterized protein n=1 Tax=Blomia tropicalis TaxID=40697 RepID=A0A9Q0RJL3_BLOTA|nr:hypothetical protein BLOT_009962 [Blomia tropicalis]KAJ6215441.1 hypothetical protein RDWZM_009941 [Blomia tropicalis]
MHKSKIIRNPWDDYEEAKMREKCHTLYWFFNFCIDDVLDAAFFGIRSPVIPHLKQFLRERILYLKYKSLDCVTNFSREKYHTIMAGYDQIDEEIIAFRETKLCPTGYGRIMEQYNYYMKYFKLTGNFNIYYNSRL